MFVEIKIKEHFTQSHNERHCSYFVLRNYLIVELEVVLAQGFRREGVVAVALARVHRPCFGVLGDGGALYSILKYWPQMLGWQSKGPANAEQGAPHGI